MRRLPRRPDPPPPPPEVDLNQVVAYNFRRARELRGWTQEEVADRLELYLGQRLTQAAVSAIERAWDGERRREFDAQELLWFAMVFDLPMLWFLLPPTGDHRLMRGTTRPVDELYIYLLGRPHLLEPFYARLKEIGIHDPTEAEEVVEKLTGQPARAREWSYRDRRKEMLLALLDQHADELDAAIDELGSWFDHLRQVGIRGFITEHTFDDDFAKAPAPRRPTDKTAPAGTVAKTAVGGRTKKRAVGGSGRASRNGPRAPQRSKGQSRKDTP